MEAFIYSPHLTPGVYNHVFHVTDWFPTLLDIVDSGYVYKPDPGYRLDGVSHYLALVDHADPPREYMLVNYYYDPFEDDKNLWTGIATVIRLSYTLTSSDTPSDTPSDALSYPPLIHLLIHPLISAPPPPSQLYTGKAAAIRNSRYKLMHTFDNKWSGAWYIADEDYEFDDDFTQYGNTLPDTFFPIPPHISLRTIEHILSHTLSTHSQHTLSHTLSTPPPHTPSPPLVPPPLSSLTAGGCSITTAISSGTFTHFLFDLQEGTWGGPVPSLPYMTLRMQPSR